MTRFPSPLCSEKGLPVCAFVKTVKQPRGGYLSPKYLTLTECRDNTFLSPRDENIHVILMGIVVDYLTRWQLTDCEPADAFDISLRGACIAQEADHAGDLLYRIEQAYGELTPDAVKAACQLAGYDVVYRAGLAIFKGVGHIYPDDNTVNRIITLVNRSVDFFRAAGIVEYGMTFMGGYTRRVTNGDADYLSADTLWDMKVSTRAPTKEHTLQMLIYRILMQRSIQYRHWPLKQIGFFNPRYNAAWTYHLDDLGEALEQELTQLVCAE